MMNFKFLGCMRIITIRKYFLCRNIFLLHMLMQELKIGFLWQVNFVSCSKSNGFQAILIVSSKELQFYLSPLHVPFTPTSCGLELGTRVYVHLTTDFLYFTPQQRNTLTPERRQISFIEIFLVSNPIETLIYH